MARLCHEKDLKAAGGVGHVLGLLQGVPGSLGFRVHGSNVAASIITYIQTLGGSLPGPFMQMHRVWGSGFRVRSLDKYHCWGLGFVSRISAIILMICLTCSKTLFYSLAPLDHGKCGLTSSVV